MTQSTAIAECRPEHLSAIAQLNNAAQPAVNGLTLHELVQLRGWSEHFKVVQVGDAVAAFLLTLPTGLDYASLNYRWFSQRYLDFVYVDRIVVSPAFHRAGLGRLLYADLIESYSGRASCIAAEVNIRPRNDTSLAFHERMTFSVVGEQDTEGGDKRVALMIRPLVVAKVAT